MKQYISYINYGGDMSNIWKSWYVPFPEDLNPIFAKSNENVNKIFDSKTEKWNITINTGNYSKKKMKPHSKDKKTK